MTTADQWQERGYACHAGKLVEESILWSKNNGRADNIRFRQNFQNGFFSTPFRTGICGLRLRMSTQRRHMGEGNACCTGCFSNSTRAKIMYRAETLAASLIKDANQIDDMVRTGDCAIHRPTVAQIGLNCLNLTNATQWLQM